MLHLQILCSVQPLRTLSGKRKKDAPAGGDENTGMSSRSSPGAAHRALTASSKGREARCAALFETQTADSFYNFERALLSDSLLTGRRRLKLTPRGEGGLMGDEDGWCTGAQRMIFPSDFFLFLVLGDSLFISGHFAPSS